MNYKSYVASLIDAPVATEEIEQYVTETSDDNFGDYAFPCFRLAKVMHMSPVQIAENLANKIKPDDVVSKAEAVNGYLNFFLNKQKVADEAFSTAVKLADSYGTSSEGADKTICIDYSSVNIAKSLHIGHLGTTAIGNSLYKLYKTLGYNVVGINHLGDYGTQFGKMIVAYKKWGDTINLQEQGVKGLQELYVRFHKEEETNPALTDEAREWFSKIENGDKEANELFELFKKITLDDVMEIYQQLNVNFDSWNGESFYNDKMAEPLAFLESKGLVSVDQGAKIVDLTDDGMPPCLLVKSDGSSLYATRDIAAAFYRHNTYHFDKCLYVVAYQQNLHFKQFFKVLEKAGCDWAKDLVHVAYGMVSLEDGAMSTRKGNTVFLRDVLRLAVEKSLDVISAKNPNLPNKQKVAEQVGVGAVLFSALENGRIKDITFTFDRVLNFDGETAPYLQYTHARCRSILEKAGSYGGKIDATVYDNVETMRLAKLVGNYPQIVKDACYKWEPSILSAYLIDVAQAFNNFYAKYRVLDGTDEERNARLQIVEATKTVLKNGLANLGIEAPDQM